MSKKQTTKTVKPVKQEKARVILEFPNAKVRDEFLGQLSDGGIEQTIMESMSMSDIEIARFDYAQAFKAWGWNGKGDPIVDITIDDEPLD